MALVPHAFERVVVEVDVRCLDVGRQRLRADREAMVLRRDLDPARSLVDDRLIRAAMAKLELERLSAICQAQQLMAQADAEDGLLAEELANVVDGVRQWLRIAGAVGDEDAV